MLKFFSVRCYLMDILVSKLGFLLGLGAAIGLLVKY